jgi:hypothetical protein
VKLSPVHLSMFSPALVALQMSYTSFASALAASPSKF